MVTKSRFTLPRELEIVRIQATNDDELGDRIELRRDAELFTAVVLTRRGGSQHGGAGATLDAALTDLAKVLPAAAQRTSRDGANIPSSKLRLLEQALDGAERSLVLQRSVSLAGAWRAERLSAGSCSERVFADTLADALIALAELLPTSERFG